MTQMPLNDRDFAEIRANVMREIERRRTRNVWVAGAAFAFGVLALVFVLLPRPALNRGGEGAAAPQRTTVQTTPAPISSSFSGAAAPPPPLVVATKSTSKKRQHHYRKRHPEPPTAVASAEPLTIELQTANPDIRIIWIAK